MYVFLRNTYEHGYNTAYAPMHLKESHFSIKHLDAQCTKFCRGVVRTVCEVASSPDKESSLLVTLRKDSRKA